MSLILDALRKMELERKAKRGNRQELRTEVLNYRGMDPVPEKRGIFWIAVVVLVVLAAVSGVFYFTRPVAKTSDPMKMVEPVRQEPPAIIPQPQTQQPPAQPLPDKSQPPKERAPVKEAQDLAEKALKSVQKGGEEGGITVSGIAWQDERYLRRAVINGALVGEGAEIQGAKVIEIRENRVRFSRGGEIFEVVHSGGAGK
jgi:general secretion pathway protein B